MRYRSKLSATLRYTTNRADPIATDPVVQAGGIPADRSMVIKVKSVERVGQHERGAPRRLHRHRRRHVDRLTGRGL